jgi:hypothetical protein
MLRLLSAAFLACTVVGTAVAADFLEKTSADGSSYVLLQGRIDEGDTERLEQLLLSGKIDSRTIAFNSPGGSLWEGVLMGRILRYRGFSTYVRPGEECVSACLFAFMGGEQRFVYPKGELGGHQFYGGNERSTSQGFTQFSTSELFKFAREMGVSSEVIEISSSTSPDNMHIFTPDELRRFKLSVPHKQVPFQDREARRLNIRPAEYAKRWKAFLHSDKSRCDAIDDDIQRGTCVFLIMDAHGVPR